MKPDPNGESLIDRPYAERQMILVVDDAVAAATRQAELDAQKNGNTDYWQQIVAAAEMVLNPASAYARLAGQAFDAWRRFRQDGSKLLQVGRSESVALEFPPGHPTDNVIYVGHPVMPTVYYTASQFHRVTFEHKFSEAIGLLMSLGATNIRVKHVRGWAQDFAANMSAPLGPVGPVAAEASIEAGVERTSTSELLFEATLSGHTEPRLPCKLVWYNHEPTWQSIAEGRLYYGLRNFSLNVSYQDDFGVNAGLRAKADKVGFELGGTFEDHHATSWNIHGQFGGS